MKYKEVIDLTKLCIKTYNPITHSVDSHFDTFIRQHKLTDLNQMVFIKKIFYGIERYEPLMTVILEDMRNKTLSKRKDAIFYKIFIFIFIFKFNDISIEDLKNILMSQDQINMRLFLNYLFCPSFDQIESKLILHYDLEFVQNQIIFPLKEKYKKMQNIIEKITDQSMIDEELEQKSRQTTEKKKNTEFEEFNLTKPQQKQLPEPITFQKQIVLNQVPENVKQTLIPTIQNEKKQRLDQIKEETVKKYKESKVQKFDFQTHKLKSNLPDIQQEVEKNFQETLNFDMKYHQTPKYNQGEANIKMNTAAVLREEQMLMQQLKQKQDREDRLYDSNEFKNWKQQMELQDEKEKIEKQYRQRIDIELAKEAFKEAQEKNLIKNKKLCLDIKQEINEKNFIKMQQQQQKYEENKDLIKNMINDREVIQVEKNKIFEQNQQIRIKQKNDIKDNLIQKQQEEQKQQLKRDKLIAEIRAISKKLIKNVQNFDKQTTMGFGLLEEMSLFDLEIKLQEVQKQKQKEKESKREQNLKAREQKINSLQSKVQRIGQLRKEQLKQRNEKSEEKMLRINEKKQYNQELKEKKTLECYAKIDKKKKDIAEQEAILKKKQRECLLQQQYMNQEANAMEQKQFQQLQIGQQYKIDRIQNQKLYNQYEVEDVLHKQQKIIAHNNKNEVIEKMSMFQTQQNYLQKAQKENDLLFKQNYILNGLKCNKQKMFENELSSKQWMNIYQKKRNETLRRSKSAFSKN